MLRFLINKRRQRLIFLAAFGILLTAVQVSSRDVRSKIPDRETSPPPLTAAPADAMPTLYYSAHGLSNMQLIIGNNATFGTEGRNEVDPFTGQLIHSCVFPRNSHLVYLWVAALWIGAVIDRDTSVSVGNEDYYDTREFWPTELWRVTTERTRGFKYESINPSSPYFSENARSEQDIICEYDDTRDDPVITGVDSYTNRPHRPLNIRVTQRSMAWSYDYADDFILFDYQVENVGHEQLNEVYMGIWIDGDVWHSENQNSEHWMDDLVGFYPSHPAAEGCGFIDTINIAYHTDNDADPIDGAWNERSPRSAIGVRVVRTPADSLKYSYNWWIVDYGNPADDWGPRRAETEGDPFRDFGDRLGSPRGDRNKYYVLKHEEFDYDLLFAAVDHTSEGWLPPPHNALDIANGYDVRNLLSFGPFDIDPGERLPITFAWIGGEDVHVNPLDFEQHYDPLYPDAFYEKLNFSNLATNSRWASWIYDNPGVDTDGDGDSGSYRVCCYDTLVTDTGIFYAQCDTMWYKGDGVPDFKGASPPPPPPFNVHPSVGALTVRFNGLISETARDRFSGASDFEGYRVYIGRDDRTNSFSVVASYDLEDFNKFVWDFSRNEYRLWDPPFTRVQLQQLYGDLIGDDDFEPLDFAYGHPYIHPDFPDSVFYFAAQDFNQSELGVETPIRRVYPDQAYPSSLDPAEADPEELTEDGDFKYFEYEITVDNLLPTVPYYVGVTAFDFGSPEVGLAALESAIQTNLQVAYPLTSVEEVEANDLKVYVYPNPYRADQNYDDLGYENRSRTESEDRMRRIHFANLPKVCKIYIYSIDGDLLRELDHSYPDGGPEAMHDTWNLITRNTQAAVSGLYYWVVESEEGVQMGKFVIIK